MVRRPTSEFPTDIGDTRSKFDRSVRERLWGVVSRRERIESLARELYVRWSSCDNWTEPSHDSIDAATTFYGVWDARKADIDEACEATT